MAALSLRIRGTFVDSAAPALSDPPKKRSASAPPCSGPEGACRDQALRAPNMIDQRYLESLVERAQHLPSEIKQVQLKLDHASGEVWDTASDCTDVPETASCNDEDLPDLTDASFTNCVNREALKTEQ